MTYGRAILGDNQFLGVNHSDLGKATVLFRQFRETDAIVEVIGWAYEAGVRDFMFTTHDRISGALSEILASRLFPEMQYTPCLPYAHKYASALAIKGPISVVMDTLRESSKHKLLNGISKLFVGDFGGMMQLLVDVELLMMKGHPVRGVFLQNILFDLLLGLNATAVLEKYATYVSNTLKVVPGFVTMNHPLAVSVLCEQIGMVNPMLCANFNIGGIRTNPSNDEVRKSFASGKSTNIAMSIFASGALDGQNPLDYVLKSKGVNSILFGSSRRENIENNTRLILANEFPPSGQVVRAT